MISVRAIGGLTRILGEGLLLVDEESISLAQLLERLAPAGGGARFDSDSIIVAVNGVKASGAFVDVVVKSGDEVTLIPIAHGG